MAYPESTQHDSVGDLIRGILTDLRTLIREEIALARVEIHEQAGRMKGAAVSLGVALAALIFGCTFLLIAAAFGLSALLNWPIWAGFLGIAVLLAIVGAFTWSAAWKRFSTVQAVPKETFYTLKENSEWIARRLSSVRK